jgi:hypothetical protein
MDFTTADKVIKRLQCFFNRCGIIPTVTLTKHEYKKYKKTIPVNVQSILGHQKLPLHKGVR